MSAFLAADEVGKIMNLSADGDAGAAAGRGVSGHNCREKYGLFVRELKLAEKRRGVRNC